MDRHLFLTLTTSAQWTLFLALCLLIYSWIERKKWLQLGGHLLFVVLAFFSLWVINSGLIIVPPVAEGAVPPAEARAMSFFLGLSLCGIIAAIGLLLSYLKSTFAKIPILILVPVGLMLFFMVYQLQRL